MLAKPTIATFFSPPNTLPQLHLLPPRHIHHPRLRHLRTPLIAFACPHPILPLTHTTSYTLQQHTSRLIIRVLLYKPPCKCLTQDTLPQTLRTLEICFDGCLELVYY